MEPIIQSTMTEILMWNTLTTLILSEQKGMSIGIATKDIAYLVPDKRDHSLSLRLKRFITRSITETTLMLRMREMKLLDIQKEIEVRRMF